MWIHTNARNSEIYSAAPTDVRVEIANEAGSKTHDRKVRVFLRPEYGVTGSGLNRRWSNSGNQGAGRNYAATYDEWGWFLAKVFEADPNSRTDGDAYNGRLDFHAKTGGKYRLKLEDN